MTRPRFDRGFTLAEVLVTIAIYAFIMAAVTGIVVMLLQQAPLRRSAISTSDQVRLFGMKFANELRNAQQGQDGSFQIAQASSTQIIFFSSFGAPSAASVDRIRYFLSQGFLYKGVVVPSGSPPSYNVASEPITRVIGNILSTTSVFTYYDGSYAGTSSALSQPVNVTLVAFVRINLLLAQKDIRAATTTYRFGIGAALRSLKTNLGN